MRSYTNLRSWTPPLEKPDSLRDYLLLPCPFCKGEAVLEVRDVMVYVSCSMCYSQGNASGVHGGTAAEHNAVMCWNRRDWQGVYHESMKVHPNNISPIPQ